jgi:hypothetical protein
MSNILTRKVGALSGRVSLRRILLTGALASTLAILSFAAAMTLVGSAVAPAQAQTGLLGTGSSAQAVASTPEGLCGSGYYRQESHSLSGAVAYLLYNGTYNCAVTIKTSSIGTPTRTTAGLQVTGSDWSYDIGDYRYYAGPVKLYGRGKCVRYFGFHGGVSYTSPWSHCG